MGINFLAAHPSAVLDDEPLNNFLKQIELKSGSKLEYGDPHLTLRMPDEMGWNWWGVLQKFATDTLGPDNCPYILATDAWRAVYVNLGIEDRILIWEGDEPDERELARLRKHEADPEVTTTSTSVQDGKVVPEEGDHPPEIIAILKQMYLECGARLGEREALQVADLLGLMRELERLLNAISCEVNENAVDALRRVYYDDPERSDDDVHIQCLCHAYLTAKFALTHKLPLWLLK